MSTKTTFKRVALVAVAAMGFGVLTTVAPATAAQPADNTLVSAVSFGATTEFIPKPNVDTATSAMRLRSVFVDICFLSISRD